MLDGTPQLAVHKGLRGTILRELKRAQPLSAKQLARTLGVSTNAIRHHLKELELERVVVYTREQRGIGAPTFTYRLSPGGEALFPQRYQETLTEVLERLTDKLGREAAVALFDEHYAELAARLRDQLAAVDAPDRVAAVARLMSDAGYMAEWHPADAGGEFRLSEHNCAIRAVAERFPEVCAAEQRFLGEVLGADVARRSHIASGCNICEYVIGFGVPTREKE